MKFINRKNEIKTLENEYNKSSSFVILYGRRRTGKTTLIKEFIKEKSAFYFFADKQNESLQIERFKNQLAEHFKDELLRKITISDWDTLFEYFINKIGEKKIIFIIDEFQYLCMVNKNFASIFQRIYDEKLSNKNIMIILCGSLISMMYSETLAYSSPLYGRRTAQIKLQPIKFQYYSEFFNNPSHKELIEFYSITSGVPKYILEFNREKTPLWNIENNILNKDNFLYSEPKFLLQEEINDLSRYFSILHTISSGSTKLSTICSQLGINSGGITPYITKLIDLDIVEKEVPVTENIDNGKIKEEVVVQSGYTKFNSPNMKILDEVPQDEFAKLVDKADVIITHGGVGSIITAITKGKKVIAVPRLGKYNEHVNDHQVEIIESFNEKGYIIGLHDVCELGEALDKVKDFIPQKYVKNTGKILKIVEDFIG